MHKPTVVFLIDTLEVGGAETSLVQLLSRFTKCKPVLVTLHGYGTNLQEMAEKAGITVVNLQVPRKLWWCRAALPYRRVLRTLQPTLVHAHLFKAEQVARLYTPSHMAVWGAFVNEPYSNQRFLKASGLQWCKIKLYQYIDRCTAHRVSHFTALTNAIIPSNAKALKVTENKITVLPRGRDAAMFPPYQPATVIGQPFILVAVARLLHRKGYAELFAAMELLLQKNYLLELIVVGSGVDEDEIKELAAPIRGAVTFVGTQNQVVTYLQKAHAFVFASHYEGFGGALVEAMLCAKPVILSNISVFQELVTPHKTGYFFEVGNAVSLANTLQWVIEHYPQACETGLAARKYAEQTFSIEAVAAKYETLYLAVNQ